MSIIRANFIVPYPPAELRPNTRAHHLAVAAARKKYRTTCAWLAKVSIGQFGRLSANAPEIIVESTIVQNSKRYRLDDDNAVRMLKHILDAVQDATGINDSKYRVRIPEQKVGKVKNPEVRVFLSAEVGP